MIALIINIASFWGIAYQLCANISYNMVHVHPTGSTLIIKGHDVEKSAIL
jgi:hypothetical protein